MARVPITEMIDKQSGVAKPIHIQRLKKAFNLMPYLQSLEQTVDSSINDENTDDYEQNLNSFDDALVTYLKDTSVDKSKLYDFSKINNDREWLKSTLLESSDSSNESSSDEITKTDYLEMLRHHVLLKKYKKKFYENEDNEQYQYYSAGILSNCKYPNLQKCDNSYLDNNFDLNDDLPQLKKIIENKFNMKKNKSLLKKKLVQKNPEITLANRRKAWVLMCKKEIGQAHSIKVYNHREKLDSCQRTAQLCMRQCQQKAMHSQKNTKEILWGSHEMQSFDHEEDEAERKINVDMTEAVRHQRKLNFLITQVELYAHFISKKLRKTSSEEEFRILNQLDEEKNPRLFIVDDYNSDTVKAKTKKNAEDAFAIERNRTRQYDIQANSKIKSNNLDDFDENHPHSLLFKGYLNENLLQEINWLISLYSQGINGILANEKSLGKTVQSIAFLYHIAEKHSVWGPFLIISPASLLPNWQQEIERFAPYFKVVSYWDNPKERKIVRQYWDQKYMHTKDASFHIVLTSYQMIVTDHKYFSRIKWQYIILDETQTVKSTNSLWWKMFLGLICRNRLLLRGVPIQNSMTELLPLLHFILPTIFDLHNDYNQWFSVDIQSHAEDKIGIDKKYISRLYMILKPFILRKIKKDVENKRSGNIEIKVSFPLITRQNLLYMTLNKKIRVEDLSHYTSTVCGENESHSSDTNFSSNLTNLVKPFKKDYNPPNLFERRITKSPLFINYNIPKFLCEYGILSQNVPSKRHILYNLLFIFNCEHIQNTSKNVELYAMFSFLHYLNMSAVELFEIMNGNLLFRWLHNFETEKYTHVLHHQRFWENNSKPVHVLTYSDFRLSVPQIKSSQILQDINFTAVFEGSLVYTHLDHIYHSVTETMQHRIIPNKMDDIETNADNKVILDNDDESSSDEITKEDYLEMLWHHAVIKKYKKKYYRKKENELYQSHCSRILLDDNDYSTYQMCTSCGKPKELKNTLKYSNLNNNNVVFCDDLPQFKKKLDNDFDMENNLSLLKKKFVQKESDVIAARRRKVWILMCKKEIEEIQRAKANNRKEKLAFCKKTAENCKSVVSLLNELDGKIICSDGFAVSFFEETTV